MLPTSVGHIRITVCIPGYETTYSPRAKSGPQPDFVKTDIKHSLAHLPAFHGCFGATAVELRHCGSRGRDLMAPKAENTILPFIENNLKQEHLAGPFSQPVVFPGVQRPACAPVARGPGRARAL